jgi:glyoxylase-like metal-dependent hydrolase (beta-lactamase superfamily II)
MLSIYSVPGAPLEVNCYLIADCEAGEAIIVDAPQQVAKLMQGKAKEWGVKVTEIVLTHGHWDHTMGITELKDTFGVPVSAHRGDLEMLENPSTAPFNMPFTLVPCTPEIFYAEGDTVKVGNQLLIVLNTTGHTPGCICLYNQEHGVLVTGDTLFAGTYGRTDFPGGDDRQMLASLRRLAALPVDTKIYPGHGPDTVLSRETWLNRLTDGM